MRQILINLVSNAVKFTEAGGVRLVVRLAEGQGPAMLRFDVTDTGIGITGRTCRKSFRPFTQVQTFLQPSFRRVGVRAGDQQTVGGDAGREISAQSQPGSGSTFTLTVETGPLEGVRMHDPVMKPLPRERLRRGEKPRVRIS